MIKSYEHLDVYELEDVAKMDNPMFAMYFAPKQCWDKKSVEEVKQDNILIGQVTALLVRDHSFVIGSVGKGVATFLKNPRNISPEYEDKYVVNNAYNSAKDLCDLLKESWSDLMEVKVAHENSPEYGKYYFS